MLSSAPWPRPNPGAAGMRPCFLPGPVPGPGTSKTTAAFRAAPAGPSALPEGSGAGVAHGTRLGGGGTNSPLLAAATARIRDGSVTCSGNRPLCRGGGGQGDPARPALCCLGCVAWDSIGAPKSASPWVQVLLPCHVGPQGDAGEQSAPAPSLCRVSSLSPGIPAELAALCCTHAWVDVGRGTPVLCALG